MIYAAAKWFALSRGFWHGLTYKPPPVTVALVDEVIRRLYAEPMRVLLQASWDNQQACYAGR